MSNHGLTSDNLHLSEPKTTHTDVSSPTVGLENSGIAVNCTDLEAEKFCAVNCTDDAFEQSLALCGSDFLDGSLFSVSHYVKAGIARNTKRAYASDLAHFKSWGGMIPASPNQIAVYIAHYAPTLRRATLVRRLAAISKAHRVIGVPSPTSNELVRATINGIGRFHGAAQHQVKALVRDELFQVLDAIGQTAKDARDRALLLIGFAGGFRRSELIGLDVSDLEQVREGVLLTLRRSKTDQQSTGRKIGIPYGRTRHCPVNAIQKWMEAGVVQEGPIFRSVSRHGAVSESRLSPEAVSLIVKRRVCAVGIRSDDYSGHSLRAGFATSAVQAGVATWKIRAQTGHASDAMLMRYVRRGELFSDNAVGALL